MGSYLTKQLTQEEKSKVVSETIKQFNVDDVTLKKIMAVFIEEAESGLQSENGGRNSIKMLPSYVRQLPNGREEGNFLALDLGGTNFRVLLINLHSKKSTAKSKTYRIPRNIMTGTGTELFDHIAKWLAEFVKELRMNHHNLDVGFTFSFPLKQEDLRTGRLITWTKGFKCSGVVGEDVVYLLYQAIKRRNDIDVGDITIQNDTVGTLLSLAFSDDACQIGAIIGTGTNACYVEKLSRCPKLRHLMTSPDDEMVINTEWGAFGDNGRLEFVLNPFDILLDWRSINPGKQTFEKAVSGMYIGELVRLVLIYLYNKRVLFVGKNIDALTVPDSFTSVQVSKVELDSLDETKSYKNTTCILSKLHIADVEKYDCETVNKVCVAVSTRSAYFCAAALAALLNRIRKPLVTVAIDGAVYCYHPRYKKLLDAKISDLVDPGIKFRLKQSEDGSGRGAALVAAVEHRRREESLHST